MSAGKRIFPTPIEPPKRGAINPEWFREANYIIGENSDGFFVAINGLTGNIDFGPDASLASVVNSAITSANGSGGGTITMNLQGENLIFEHINPRSNIKLYGMGPGTVLKLENSVNDAVIRCDQDVVNVILSDFSIDGNYANQDEATNVFISGVELGSTFDIAPFYNVNGVVIERIWVKRCSRMGIHLETCTDLVVSRVYFDNGGGDDDLSISENCEGILVELCVSINKEDRHPSGPGVACYEIEDGAKKIVFDECIARDTTDDDVRGFTVKHHEGKPPVEDVTFINCLAWNTGWYGFLVTDSTFDVRPINIFLIDCRSIDCGVPKTDVGILIDSSDGVQIIGGRIEGSGSRGIQIDNVTEVVIIGTHVMTSATDGIMISGADSTEIQILGVISKNNNTSDGFAHGIHIKDATVANVTIIGCRIFDDRTPKLQDHGIRVDNDADYVTILGNDLKGNLVTGVSLASGTHHRLPEIRVDSIFDDSDANVSLSNIGRHVALSMADAAASALRFNFKVPSDFQELVRARLVVVPAATGNLRRTVAAHWGACDEAYDADVDAMGQATVIGLTVNQIRCLDIGPTLTGITAGDHVGVLFTRNADHGEDTIDNVLYVLQFWAEYV